MTEKDNLDDSKEWGELRKVVVFIPIDEIGEAGKNFNASEKMASPSSAAGKLKKKTLQNRDATRAEAKRLHWASQGLTQINIVIKNTPEFRNEFAILAKRTITAECWTDVIEADPQFRALKRSLESAEVRLLRIDDLEERHRRAYHLMLLGEAVSSSRGYKRFLLYLAGILKMPWVRRNGRDSKESESMSSVTANCLTRQVDLKNSD